MKINNLQVELGQLSKATESLKAKHELLRLRSNEQRLSSESRSIYPKLHCTEQRRPLSLDQCITKARATRKHSRMHEYDKNYKHELAVELEIARIKSCSLQVDRILEMQYEEVQKLLLRWKATGSDQIMKIRTFQEHTCSIKSIGNGRHTIKYDKIIAICTCMNDDPYQTDKNMQQ